MQFNVINIELWTYVSDEEILQCEDWVETHDGSLSKTTQAIEGIPEDHQKPGVSALRTAE